MDSEQKEYLLKRVKDGYPVHVNGVVCKTVAEFKAAIGESAKSVEPVAPAAKK